VKRAHVSAMTELPFARIAVLAVVLEAAAVAGCTTTATSGGGYSGKGSRGDWDNFRAEATGKTELWS
jgi:hypothetical protein